MAVTSSIAGSGPIAPRQRINIDLLPALLLLPSILLIGAVIAWPLVRGSGTVSTAETSSGPAPS